MKASELLAALAALTLLAAESAAAQDLNEIVVTAQRREYDPTETPQIVMLKRADFLLTKVRVVCDTRDLSQRRAELRATLRNMIRAASSDSRIALGIGEEVVGAFDEGMLDTVIVPDARKADTSQATLLIKTSITSADSFDVATARIRKFVEGVDKVGRTEVLLENGFELSIIEPNQYRANVAKLVAEDARRMSALFGEGYGVEVQGLQLPVSWYQAGPLDLALYIPYRLTVRPVR